MKQKQIIKTNRSTLRLRAAALVFSAAFAAASCGEFPQCQVNYQKTETALCQDALKKLKRAKEMQRKMIDFRDLAKERLKARIHNGEEYPKGLDEYNLALRNLFVASAQLSLLSNLKRETEDGLVSGGELEKAEEALDSIVLQLGEIKATFLKIVEQN